MRRHHSCRAGRVKKADTRCITAQREAGFKWAVWPADRFFRSQTEGLGCHCQHVF